VEGRGRGGRLLAANEFVLNANCNSMTFITNHHLSFNFVSVVYSSFTMSLKQAEEGSTPAGHIATM